MHRLRRLTFPDCLAVAAGVGLIGATFFSWVHRVSSGGLTGQGDPHSPPADLDAWKTFGPLALVLVAAAMVPLGTAGRLLWRQARTPGGATAAAGAIAEAFVVAGTALNLGEFGFKGPDSFFTIRSVGLGVLGGFLAAFAMTTAGLLAMWNERHGGRPAER